jgi:hypothetical protein
MKISRLHSENLRKEDINLYIRWGICVCVKSTIKTTSKTSLNEEAQIFVPQPSVIPKYIRRSWKMAALLLVSIDFLWIWALCKEHGSFVSSGFFCGVNEICVVLGIVQIGTLLLMFQEHLSVPSSRVKILGLLDPWRCNCTWIITLCNAQIVTVQ